MGPRHPTDAARPRPRPRFERTVPLPRDEVLARVRAALGRAPSIRGLVLPTGRIELTVAEAEQHVWSPQLTVDVVDGPEESGSTLRARFGPHPNVWTLYVALYAVSVFFAIACAVYGASQAILDRTPWALWLTPIAVVLAALVYGASFVGQGLGSEQMYRVRAFLDAAVDDG